MELSRNHKYYEGYITYSDIQLSNLPPTVKINNRRLYRKNEFHITLVNVKKIASLINPVSTNKPEEEIVGEFKKFLKKSKLDQFELIHKFRFVSKDTKKSLIVMCQVPGAENFFKLLKKKYKKNLPLQPFHITLYTLQVDTGIGILSDEELIEISKPVKIPELEALQACK